MPLYDPTNGRHTVTIEKSASSRDPGGGTQPVYTTRTAGVKGFLAAATAGEIERFAAAQIRVTHTFATADASARRGDRLVYGGRYLIVVGIVANEAAGTIPALQRLMLEEWL